MPSHQTRYDCLIAPCDKKRDFSLLTLYEHLCYHLKDKGFTEHFEYRCVPCKAFFTNKVFMVRHKMENEDHEIERMPDIDLVNPHKDERLRRAVQLLTDDYLRYKFRVSGVGGSVMQGMPGTPRYGDNILYSPRTPRTFSTPGTPRYEEENRARDFSNCFANATPSRPLDRHSIFDLPPMDNNLTFEQMGLRMANSQNGMLLDRQLSTIRTTFGSSNDSCMNTSYSSRYDNSFDNGGSSFRSRDGGTTDRGYNRGGRDFQSTYDSGISNDNYNRNDRNDRGSGMRDRGGRGSFRGERRGRGNFRGGDDDRGRGGRGRGRARGAGHFNNRDDSRNNDRGRSRSRSPMRRAPPPADSRCSYSRSRSPSDSPSKNKAPALPARNDSPPRNTRERSYSGSPKSD